MTHPGSWPLTSLLAVLGLTLHPGCATGTSPPLEAQPSHEQESSEELFPRGFLVVYPGQLDAEDRYLSSVMVIVGSEDPSGSPGGCSGVLIHPRLVITAGHCVCPRRLPTAHDTSAIGNGKVASRPTHPEDRIRRVAALQGAALTGFIDARSPCSEDANVFTASYTSAPAQVPQERNPVPSRGKVRLHPGLEIVFGRRAGAEQVMWSNADLAAIFLEKPISLELPRIELADSEVQLGDIITMIGFGAGTLTPGYGFRHFGDNKVNRLIPLETGSTVFRAEEQLLPDGKTASHAQPGDSGGACIKKGRGNVLVGIATVGAVRSLGGRMSVFTSVYSHRDWLLQMLQKAEES